MQSTFTLDISTFITCCSTFLLLYKWLILLILLADISENSGPLFYIESSSDCDISNDSLELFIFENIFLLCTIIYSLANNVDQLQVQLSIDIIALSDFLKQVTISRFKTLRNHFGKIEYIVTMEALSSMLKKILLVKGDLILKITRSN